jgi:two-component system, chemotaxis family, chemotaxis protein CheY
MNTRLKVFVLDYYQTMTCILINFLRRFGFTDVECLKNGVEAFEKLNQSLFDFIIAYWDMQQKTGIELLRKVQASEALKYL